MNKSVYLASLIVLNAVDESLIKVENYGFLDPRGCKMRQGDSLLSNFPLCWRFEMVLDVLEGLESLDKVHLMSI